MNESCMDSPVSYPKVLNPLPWEPTIAFAPGQYEIEPHSLEGVTVFPPSYRLYSRAAIRMAPTSAGKSVALGQNPHYDEPKFFLPLTL